MAKKVLIHNLSAPLGDATTAKIDVNVANGNLTINKLIDGEQMLASGILEYLENQGLPTLSVDMSHGQANLNLKARSTGRPGLYFPWSACNGATEWHIRLNPDVQSDISAHSGGGNVKLDLGGMAVTRVAADTGGGNMNVVLPDNVANLSVTARTGGGNVTVDIGNGIIGNNLITATSGAGNVVVHIPRGVAARIHASSGWGKTIIDPHFGKIDKNTYQSCNFDRAVDKVEIRAGSGAGNVSVTPK